MFLSSFDHLVMGVFSNSLRKMQAIFPKAMLGLGVGWIIFTK
jgi:hypothetical protein